jgi:hypothetical protein
MNPATGFVCLIAASPHGGATPESPPRVGATSRILPLINIGPRCGIVGRMTSTVERRTSAVEVEHAARPAAAFEFSGSTVGGLTGASCLIDPAGVPAPNTEARPAALCCKIIAPSAPSSGEIFAKEQTDGVVL